MKLLRIIWPFKSSILIFFISLIIYSGIGTAFQFSFKECTTFPTYNMLTKAFYNNRTDIEYNDLTDISYRNGKRYLYFGPLPAIIRLSFFMLFKQEISTGWMISIYCAGICTFFYLSLCSLAKEFKGEMPLSIPVFMLTAVMIFNGYSLTITSIPSIHSEAISAAMFFIMGGIYLYLTMRSRKFENNYINITLFSIFIGSSFACRFSYIFIATLLGIFFIVEYLRIKEDIIIKELILNTLIIISISLIVIIILLNYNHARFGAFFDFGNRYISSYSKYFIEQGYFRYDHIPYNLWNIFFRLPTINNIPPFIHLPGYIIEVKSLILMKYRLINQNELSASIFILLPITIFAFCYISQGISTINDGYKTLYLMLMILLFTQIIMIALTVAVTIRYFYDFIPIILLCSFIGAVRLKSKHLISDEFIIFMSAISIIISFSIFLNAILFYLQFIGYISPVLPYLFPIQ